VYGRTRPMVYEYLQAGAGVKREAERERS